MIYQFLSGLVKQDVITEFTDELWYNMVDRMTIYSKDEICFTLKNGTGINM